MRLSQSICCECYFNENVHHGIRSFDDVEIWQEIKEWASHSLNSDDYAQDFHSLPKRLAANIGH